MNKFNLKYKSILIIIFFASFILFKINNPSPNASKLLEDNTIYATIDDNESELDYNVTSSNDKLTNNISIPVLYYHSVREPSANEVTITPNALKQQLTYIKSEYVPLTFDQFSNYLLNNIPIPEKSILITFDDGYMDNYENAFPILKELGIKATIFCIASNLDGSYYLSTGAIKEMCNYGIDIESHTVNHKKLDSLSYEDQLLELKNSKNILENITGKRINAIAYPFGNFNEDTIKASKEAGYSLGLTTNRGLADRDGNLLKIDRIYISSNYDFNTFKNIISTTNK